jgi:ABC-type glycerol-3-phosphate transport system substrate-binding protein
VGVAPVPQPEGAPPVAYGPACNVDCIPATSRHPEAARKYLRWFYSPRPDGRPSPSSDYSFMIHNIPAKRSDAMQERFMSDPKFKVFVNELISKPVVTIPMMPVSLFMMDELERQRGLVGFYETTPEQAMKDTEEMTNRALDRVRALMKRSGAHLQETPK